MMSYDTSLCIYIPVLMHVMLNNSMSVMTTLCYMCILFCLHAHVSRTCASHTSTHIYICYNNSECKYPLSELV